MASFLFWIKASNLERVLGWFRRRLNHDVKILIAKVIHQQLDRAFASDEIVMHVPCYAEYSAVLAELLQGVSNVCFTCIYSPKRWFEELDEDRYTHDTLPEWIAKELGAGYFDAQAVEDAGIAPSRVPLFPSHYIEFLKGGGGNSQRRRVFLLNDAEWEETTTASHRAFYKKFIGPCKVAKIETRFVKTKVLEATIQNAPDRISKHVLPALRDGILSQDYAVFEKQAVMSYVEPPLGVGGAVAAAEDADDENGAASVARMSSPVLRFWIGYEARRYVRFLDVVFSDSVGEQYGV